MAYPYFGNNYFPNFNGYQIPQPIPEQQMNYRQPQQMQPECSQNPMVWVQGEAGAKAYLVAPGNVQPLWDSENSTIYIKSVDASGIPSMRYLDYTERTTARPVQQPAPTMPDLSQYVTRDEFNDLKLSIDALSTQRKQTKTTAKDVTENG